MTEEQKTIYRIVKRIPKGKVATYGQVALIIQNSKIKNTKFRTKITPRLVGRTLHQNPDPESIPCHRVVNSKGFVADSFAFGGWEGQKRMLEKEGVVLKNKRIIDVSKFFWEEK